MSVYDDLAQILSARYGKDVRQAIHDAIQQCYSDATGNPESVAAFADDILDLKSTDNNINATIGNLQTTISGLQSTITSMQTTINGQFNKFFPIGSLYVTGDDTFDPNNAEGWQGTWSKIEGRFILGSSDDYEVNDVGGEATHTLSVNEMPNHGHNVQFANKDATKTIFADWNGSGGASWTIEGLGATNNASSPLTAMPEGGGQPHNNMPPYEVKHIWERTA